MTGVMVFVIQHTQARHQAATQRELDEILRVLPDADHALLALSMPLGPGTPGNPARA